MRGKDRSREEGAHNRKGGNQNNRTKSSSSSSSSPESRTRHSSSRGSRSGSSSSHGHAGTAARPRPAIHQDVAARSSASGSAAIPDDACDSYWTSPDGRVWLRTRQSNGIHPVGRLGAEATNQQRPGHVADHLHQAATDTESHGTSMGVHPGSIVPARPAEPGDIDHPDRGPQGRPYYEAEGHATHDGDQYYRTTRFMNDSEDTYLDHHSHGLWPHGSSFGPVLQQLDTALLSDGGGGAAAVYAPAHIYPLFIIEEGEHDETHMNGAGGGTGHGGHSR